MATPPRNGDADRHLPEGFGQLVTRRVDELRAHPSYLRHGLSVSASQLSAISAKCKSAFQDPIVVTRDRVVLDGYARWAAARQQHREVLPCIEYDLTEEDGLELLLQRHRRHAGLNPFLRILLALDLEPSYQEKARANQKAGGQKKGWSTLTKAQKVVVRSQIGAAAGTSTGSVTKVKQILISVQPELQEALRRGEISIHRAWLWRTLRPTEQVKSLRLHQSKKGVGKAIREALSQHKARNAAASSSPVDLARFLSQLNAVRPEAVSVIPIKMPGRNVFISEELMEVLKLKQQELNLK
ncbi:MAG TPA: ParB/RepB/Spo0J family partition protein [Terriglobales bacterium]|nr:ParB/RepB/Spo0J family partition protein [Terriglobales bacterium]